MTEPSRAPVSVGREAFVAADPEVVWRLLVEVDRWPDWNPDVGWVRASGPLAEGATFRWKSGPGTITSTVLRLEPARVLSLAGGTLGVRATHVWRLEPRGPAGTVVRTEEAWSGPVARLLRVPLQRRLDRRIDERLAHLRSAAEGRRPPLA